MSGLALRAVSKRFGARTVLRDIDLTIASGEFVAIVGFSGSGKTTLINLIAGLVPPDSGDVVLNGQPVLGPGPDRGVVFQNYALLPWLTVRANLALAVDALFSHWPAAKRAAHVQRHLELVNLGAAGEKYPVQLSGGMRQRVSLARALAMDPEVLLLDEPLSALDALTRGTLQGEIERIWQRQRKTVVMITNDVDEALLLADRIIPLTPGPTATLGPAIPVPLPRPRDRKGINHDTEFKRLRAHVTTWLLDAAASAKAKLPVPQRTLPALLTNPAHAA